MRDTHASGPEYFDANTQFRLPALVGAGTTDPTGCTVTTTESADAYTIEVDVPGNGAFSARSAVDFEDALCQLRLQLDAAGILLLCNRFRRNAFVSSLVRQMTGGLGCYLVE